MNYYNENDPKPAAWIRELIKARLIPYGIVDERIICDVQPNDLSGFTQCHWFAGIAGWPLALRIAGWPEDRECHTGSCPCQPFSVGSNNRQGGVSDTRHLWPTWSKLIKERNPPIIFGEQVENAVSHGWLDEVFGDLEDCGYATAAAVLPACAVEADHERKRLFWVANSKRQRWQGHIQEQRLPGRSGTPLTIAGNPFTDARQEMDHDTCDLLVGDGVSVGMARSIIKGFGNAIVSQAAAIFIQSAIEAINEMQQL